MVQTVEKPIKVLVADDNRDFCEVLGEFIRNQPDMALAGVAHTGAEAVELIGNVHPDVLILDLIMPHVDGIGVLEHLTAQQGGQNGHTGHNGRPRVIVLTAFGHEQVTSRAMQLGADYFVLKPFSLEVLAKRIRQMARGDREPRVSPLATRNLEVEVTTLLHGLGVPAHVRGYQYVRDAIVTAVQRPECLGAITKDLYPSLAARHNTTPTRVERAIRHAIEVACTRGNREQLAELFGFSLKGERGKPTNSEFVAKLSDLLRMDLHR